MSNVLKETVRGIDLIPIEDMLLNESKIFLIGEVNPASAGELIKRF